MNTPKSTQLKYRCLSILPFSSFISAITLGAYICFRVKCMLTSDSGNNNASASATAWLYLFVELGFLGEYFLAQRRCISMLTF